MARFDVYRWRDAYVVDCQAGLLSDLPTRFVVPLLSGTESARLSRLNPPILFEGKTLTLVPQLATTLTVAELGRPMGNLADEEYRITAAIDVLLGGV